MIASVAADGEQGRQRVSTKIVPSYMRPTKTSAAKSETPLPKPNALKPKNVNAAHRSTLQDPELIARIVFNSVPAKGANKSVELKALVKPLSVSRSSTGRADDQSRPQPALKANVSVVSY